MLHVEITTYPHILSRDVARMLFKSWHNMIEERSVGIKASGESKVEHPRL